MKKHYETLMLLPATATQTDIAAIEKQLKTLTKSAVGAFDKWGRYKLAYPINKQEYGIYLLARYEVTEVQAFFQKFEHFLKVKCVETVMRHVHVSLTPEQYAEAYIKPEAMEGNTRDYRGRAAAAAVSNEPVAEQVVAESAAVEVSEAVETVVEG